MSSLKTNEKKLFEDLFGMASGYVLDFSDNAFSEFFHETVQINICSEQYLINGNSKAKILRAFWDIDPDPVVGWVLSEMLNRWRDNSPYTDCVEDKRYLWGLSITQRLQWNKGKEGPFSDYIATLYDLDELAFKDHREASSRLRRLETRIEETLRENLGQKEADQFKKRPLIAIQQDEYISNVLRQIKAVRDYLLQIEEELQYKQVQPESKIQETATELATGSRNKQLSNRVFIVHGRDNEMKHHVARTVSNLKLDPIILHEQANAGRTIIEKLIDYSDVGFAVVLLSPDDVGALEGEELRHRARQNVIFELGLFIGLLGRDRVITLFRPHPDFDIPNDYSGVVFVEYTDAGAWINELVRELKSAGYRIDANTLYS